MQRLSNKSRPQRPDDQHDWHLVAALRRGNPAAFETLTRRYYDLTYRLAMNAHDGRQDKALASVRQFFLHLWQNADLIPPGYESPGVSFQHYLLNAFAQIHLQKSIFHQDVSRYY